LAPLKKKRTAPHLAEPLLKCGLVSEKLYGVGCFAGAAGFGADIAAGFGFQNPGSDLIQSSLT
jgi:hypothetical protein